MQLLFAAVVAAALCSADAAPRRVRAGRGAAVLAADDAAGGSHGAGLARPKNGRILSLTLNMGAKDCAQDMCVGRDDARRCTLPTINGVPGAHTLAARAGLSPTEVYDASTYPYDIVILSTQESSFGAGTDFLDAAKAALHVPERWRVAEQTKGGLYVPLMSDFETTQRIYYNPDVIHAAGDTHGKFIGQGIKKANKNFLLRTLTFKDHEGHDTRCAVDIVSTHMPMTSDEKSGGRAGMQYREDAIAELHTWRRDVLHTAQNAAILSGEYGGAAAGAIRAASCAPPTSVPTLARPQAT